MVPESHLKFLKFLYVFVGWWPIKINNLFVKIVYKTYSNVGIIGLAVFTSLVGLYALMACIRNDKNNFLEAFAMTFVLLFGATVKVIVCSSSSMYNLIMEANENESKTLRNADKSTRNLYEKCARHAKLKTISYAFILAATGYTFSVFAYFEIIVDQRNITKGRRRVTLIWVPFDTDIHYMIDYVICTILNYLITTYAVLVQTLLISVLCFISIQLKMLQHSVRNFSPANKSSGYRLFCLIIKRHQFIIEFVKKFNGLVQWATFVDFLVNSLIFAVSLVRFVSTRNAIIFIYLPFQILPMIWTYWEANEVQIQSMLVASAVYENNWIQLNEKTKRAMLLMAVRAQKALQIRIGPFYIMSTQTLMQAFKASYTYLSIVRKNA